MPTWAQVFFAVTPLGLFLLGCVFWVVRRIAGLEGKVDAILTLLAALVQSLGQNPGGNLKVPGIGPAGRQDERS